MNFKLAIFTSIIVVKALNLGAIQVAEQDGQLLGLIDSETRNQLEETTGKLTDTVEDLLGLDLNKLQLLPNDKNENVILANLKPDQVKEQSEHNEGGIVNDLLDVVTIPKN